MRSIDLLEAADAEEWRAWLAEHHAAMPEIWLVFFKKATGRTGVEYEAALDEALCFGWIDSLVRRVDDARYARKFSPRKAKSNWSATNRKSFARLVSAGRMTAAGHAKGPPAEGAEAGAGDDAGSASRSGAALSAGAAWTNFRAMAPGARNLYLKWIGAARRPDTRARRIAEAVELLARNEKLGLK